MTRMIFIRHGESSGNALGRFYGHFDGALTDLGRAQADCAAAYLKDTPIDAAYGSDLVRAYETGQRIAAPHGLTVVPDKNLREIFAGDWENRLFDELKDYSPNEYDTWMHDIARACPPNGESVAHLAKRIHDEVWRIAKEHEGQTVLIATHATPIRTLQCEWEGVPFEQMQTLHWVKNASTSIVDYDAETGKVHPVVIGEASYLQSLTTELPTNI